MMFVDRHGFGDAQASSSGAPALAVPPVAPAGWSTGTKVLVGVGVLYGAYTLFKFALRTATFGIL